MDFHYHTGRQLTSRYWECADMECLDGGGTLTGTPLPGADAEAEAVAHTRATGHATTVIRRHSTEYLPCREPAAAGPGAEPAGILQRFPLLRPRRRAGTGGVR